MLFSTISIIVLIDVRYGFKVMTYGKKILDVISKMNLPLYAHILDGWSESPGTYIECRVSNLKEIIQLRN